jgi:hypothetical protein
MEIPAAIFDGITGAGAAAIVITSVAEAAGVRLTESCKPITMLVVPTDVGVPDITPVAAFNVNPAGSVTAVKVFV